MNDATSRDSAKCGSDVRNPDFSWMTGSGIFRPVQMNLFKSISYNGHDVTRVSETELTDWSAPKKGIEEINGAIDRNPATSNLDAHTLQHGNYGPAQSKEAYMTTSGSYMTIAEYNERVRANCPDINKWRSELTPGMV